MSDLKKSSVKANPAIVMNGRIMTPKDAAKLVASGRARPATQIDVARSGVAVSPASLKASAALIKSAE